jgi:signal transduction histidine kinase
MEKVDRLNKMAEQLISGRDPGKLLKLGQNAHQLARRLSYIRGEAYSLVFMGFAHWFLSDHEVALENLKEAQSLFERIGDREGFTKALVPLLSVQKNLGTYDQSLSHNLECLKFFRATGDGFWEGLALLALGTLFYDLGDFEKSIRYSEEAVKVAEAIDTDWMVARGLVHVGSVYRSRGAHDEALSYFQRSLEIFRAEDNPMGEARALNELGTSYQALGEDEKALEFHLESLQIREKLGQRQAQCTSLISLGRLFIQRKEVKKALELLEKSLSISCETNSKPRAYQSHQALSEAYELSGDPAVALKHHREFQRIKEEVFSNDANARLKNLQMSFEVEKAEKEAEIARLRNVELKDKNEQLEKLLEELRATQVQLVHAEKMASLGKLVAGIAHELNSPIGALGSANLVIARCISNLRVNLDESETIEELRENQSFKKTFGILESDTKVIATAAERVTALVRRLKNFARLDEAAFQRADLSEGLNSAVDLLGSELEGRVKVVKEYDQIPNVPCYPGEMNQVFLSLLTNAAEAIEGEGTIRIKASEDADSIHIRISDTGSGIPEEKLKRLFDFDFTTHGSRIKLGSGLVTARNIARKHGGDLDVESQVGRGSTFKIRLSKKAPETTGS